MSPPYLSLSGMFLRDTYTQKTAQPTTRKLTPRNPSESLLIANTVSSSHHLLLRVRFCILCLVVGYIKTSAALFHERISFVMVSLDPHPPPLSAAPYLPTATATAILSQPSAPPAGPWLPLQS